jgi:hypothetical protein
MHPYAMARNRQQAKATNTAGATVIRWTEAEKEGIAGRVLDLFVTHPDMTKSDALREAVRAMPPNRRKTIVDWAHNPWIVPILERLAASRDAANATEQTTQPEAQEMAKDEAQHELDGVNIDTTPATVEAPVKGKRGGRPGVALLRWTDAERMLVAKAYVKNTLDFPTMSKTDAVRKAMFDALPENRQRQLDGYASAKQWLEPLLNQARHEIQIERDANASQRAEKENEERQRIEGEQRRQQIEAEAQRRLELSQAELRADVIAQFMESAPLEDFIAIAARRIAAAFVRPIVAELQDGIAAAIKATMPAQAKKAELVGIAPPTQKRPKVAIAGLINQQIRDIEHEFDGVLDLVFVKNQDEGGAGVAAASSAELVVACTDFFSHSLESKLKKRAKQYVRITGSVSAAKRFLHSWLAGESRQAS